MGSNPTLTSSAEVFGYFILDGISHTLPKELSQLLQSELTIIKIEESPFSVSRACGSYSVGGVAYIKENLKALLEKIGEVFLGHKSECTFKNNTETICTCLKCNNQEVKEKKVHTDNILAYCLQKPCECCTYIRYEDIDSHKWFINGKYHPLTPFLLTPAKFARGIQTVTIDDLDLRTQRIEPHPLVWIYNYRQRHYLPKIMKDNLQHPTDPFKNVF